MKTKPELTVDKMAEEILKSKLYRLAKIQLYRKGIGEKITMPSGKKFYHAEFPDILETMSEIVNKLHEKQQGWGEKYEF